MPVASQILCLWPGLPGLWVRGDVRSLAQAVLFTLMLCGAVSVHVFWPAFCGHWLHVTLWCLCAGFWLVALVVGRAWLKALCRSEADQRQEALFRLAQNEYLKGAWSAAESALARLLEYEPRDIEGRLLLATVYRRTDRWDQAREQIARLNQYEAAVYWELEIEQELASLESPPAVTTASSADSKKVHSEQPVEPGTDGATTGAASQPTADAA